MKTSFIFMAAAFIGLCSGSAYTTHTSKQSLQKSSSEKNNISSAKKFPSKEKTEQLLCSVALQEASELNVPESTYKAPSSKTHDLIPASPEKTATSGSPSKKTSPIKRSLSPTSKPTSSKTGTNNTDVNKSPRIEKLSEDKKPQTASLTSSSYSHRLTSTSTPTSNYFNNIRQTVKRDVPSPTSLISSIDVASEESGGSRRWVKIFKDTATGEAHEWHKKSLGFIKAIRESAVLTDNIKEGALPFATNFATTRLTYIMSNKKVEIQEIPSYFVSGLPQSKLQPSFKEFSKKYRNYSLDFISTSYKNGESVSKAGVLNNMEFKAKLQQRFERAYRSNNSLINKIRLNTHTDNFMKDKPDLPQKYFHSEQAFLLQISDMIEKFKINNKRNITPFLTTPVSITYIIVDICSYRDMCWYCGDTLATACHTEFNNPPIAIRASGYISHCDFDKQDALRSSRESFLSYRTNQAYEVPGIDEKTIYKPYIAHIAREDLP